MAEYDRQTLNARAGSAVAIDEGLRSYMLRVYNYMGIGLVVTGLAAWFAATAAITPPFDPPVTPSCAGVVTPRAIRSSAVANMSLNVFCLCRRRPCSHQDEPNSPPPRKWLRTKMPPASIHAAQRLPNQPGSTATL